MDSLLDRCRALASRATVGPDELGWAIAGRIPDDAELAPLLVAAPTYPYGRHPYVRAARVEAMIATWTRARPCAPHDHSGSHGAVRVVRGRALHRQYELVRGDLRMVEERRFGEGETMDVDPTLVHAMVDDGADRPLVTAHVYSAPIDSMLVYDVAARRTLIVGDECGAWVPVTRPDLVLRHAEGFVSRPQLLAEATP